MIRKIIEEGKWLIALVTLLSGLSVFSYLDIKSIDKNRERARYIAMSHYEPVGNGGALAEINGHITPQRKDMYDRIQETYRLKLLGESPISVRKQYDVLRNNNLSEIEKREEIRVIKERYNGCKALDRI